MNADLLRDADAERAVLGALLLAPRRVAELTITASDFDQAVGNDRVFAALQTVIDRDGTADELMVLQQLRSTSQLDKIGYGDNRGALYLHHLVATVPTASNLSYYAQQVRATAIRRRVASIGEELQRAAVAPDMDDALDGAAQLLVHLQLTVDEPAADAPIAGLSPLEAFVDEPGADYEWVIPGVMERADRVIIIASEGAGKSTWSRQVAVTLASGLHPFEPNIRIPPKRTLLVDLENPPDMVRRKTRHLVQRARDLGVWSDGRAFRWTKPAGLDLRRHGDQQLFDRVLNEVRPDLVCLGPLYKAFLPHGDSWEQAASELAAVLDRARERHGVAFWLEHHMPKEQAGSRSLVPFGSGLWQRWPEFGFALKRHDAQDPGWLDLVTFRGSRDERCWPTGIERSSRWPWKSVWSPEAQAELDAYALKGRTEQ